PRSSFLTDTSTPAIYPLSLHDALPILSVTTSRVEELCGDLSRIRAPRGTELNARQWSTEAPLRMLLNNLDAEVAEKPQELIVYGDRKSTRLNSSHVKISYAVFCLKKKK